MLMLDLCAGLGGASQAMKQRGWEVVTLDDDPVFHPDIVADIRTWSWDGPRPDLLWISPPCIEFSREAMPWTRTGKTPDLSIAKAGLRLVDEIAPRFWILENVRGAIRWFAPIMGKWRAHYGPFFLWGWFPPLGDFRLDYRPKESYNSRQAAERAMIPWQLSEAVAHAVESYQALWSNLGKISR